MRIGVSGHQSLGCPETVDWVREQMVQHLQTHDVSAGISSLANGADQLFASAIVERQISLEVVIPCERYEETFNNPTALSSYQMLLSAAAAKRVLNFAEPSEEAFLEAGRLIVDSSDAMVLVWDGNPAAGRGGTGDIAEYASVRGRPYFWLNPRNRTSSNVPV